MSRQMLCIAVLLCCMLAGILLVGCSGGGDDIGALIYAMVFMRNAGGAEEEAGAVWLMADDGNDKVLIDDPNYDLFQGALSPDGTRLVATAWTVLRLLDLQTGNWSTPYDSPDDEVSMPNFSPDGETIIFSDTDDGSNTFDIYTVDVDGGGATKLRNSTIANEYFLLPSYNAAGTKIVFQLNTNQWAGRNVAIMDADGTDLDLLEGDAMHPSFLPDGRVLFINEDSNNEIWVMNPDGSNQVALGNTPQNVSFPTCDADGSAIAWAQGLAGSRDIYVAPFNGTNLGAPVNLTTDTTDACWRPAFGLIGSRLWP